MESQGVFLDLGNGVSKVSRGIKVRKKGKKRKKKENDSSLHKLQEEERRG